MEIINILKYVAAVAAVLLIITILLQARSGGLGATFGGSTGGGEAYRSKRGVEKVIFRLTILSLTVFATASLLIAWLSVA